MAAGATRQATLPGPSVTDLPPPRDGGRSGGTRLSHHIQRYHTRTRGGRSLATRHPTMEPEGGSSTFTPLGPGGPLLQGCSLGP